MAPENGNRLKNIDIGVIAGYIYIEAQYEISGENRSNLFIDI